MKLIISIQKKFQFVRKNKSVGSKKDIVYFNVKDKQNKRLLIYIAIIIIFSLLDAYFTLKLIDNGGFEINPIMEFLLGISPSLFVMGKLLFTIIGVSFLFVSRNEYFKPFSVRAYVFLPIFAVIYVIVVFYGYFLNSVVL